MLSLTLTLSLLPFAPASLGELALAGLDPVALCSGEEIPGVEDLTASQGRYTYRFASEASRETFLEAPERWGIQWDGGCARMGPLSGKGSPERWTVHGERVYVFASDACRDTFRAAPERYATTPSERLVPTEHQLAEGRRWIEKAVVAHGGADAIDSKRVLTLLSERSAQGWNNVHEIVATADGRIARRSSWIPPTPDAEPSESLWVVAESSFARDGDGTRDITSPEVRGDVQRYAHRQPLVLLWARTRDDFEAIWLGPGKLRDVESVQVLVRVDGLETTLHLAPADGDLLGLAWKGRAASGMAQEIVERLAEWREVDGVRLPVGRDVWADGEERATFASYWHEATLSQTAPDWLTNRG